MKALVKSENKKMTTIDIVYVGIFAALIAICSWINIPTVVPFTLQTFAVFLAVGILGGKRGTLSVIVYILLGAVGVPVFAGFSGGLGILFGKTGGYILGFIFSAIIMWVFEYFFGKKIWSQIVSMLLGLVACYAVGTAWFIVVYSQANGAVGVMTALGWCVFPFIIPDLCKITLAFVLSKRLSRFVK